MSLNNGLLTGVVVFKIFKDYVSVVPQDGCFWDTLQKKSQTQKGNNYVSKYTYIIMPEMLKHCTFNMKVS